MSSPHTVWLVAFSSTSDCEPSALRAQLYDSQASAERAVRSYAHEACRSMDIASTIDTSSIEQVIEWLSYHDYGVVFQERDIWTWDDQGTRTLELHAKDQALREKNGPLDCHEVQCEARRLETDPPLAVPAFCCAKRGCKYTITALDL